MSTSTSTKALIGILLGGTVGVIIFLFVHLSNDADQGLTIGSQKAAAACTRGHQDCLPDVSYIDTQGTAYTTASLAGKIVIVNFWATWCKPCLKEIPDLSKVYEKYKQQGVVILGVMTDDPDNGTLLNFQSDNNMSYPVVRANSDLLVSFSYPSSLPTTFIYDRTGKQIGKPHIGALHETQLDSILKPLLGP
ncbi:MAG: TlpA family protein disulfide reductase [Deltaproteobacteria bacterium]|nr:TlpA family protein disulfide reductase [Deltaproteobacteria bacterium]